MGSAELEKGFASLLLSHGSHLALPDKYRLLSGLVYLTYYHPSSSDKLAAQEEFIDYLRKEMAQLGLQEVEEVEFLQLGVALLMNLASVGTKDFNLYLAESDVCGCIIKQTARTHNQAKHMDANYLAATHLLRDFTLRLLKNVINPLSPECCPLVVSLVSAVLRDDVYLEYHSRCSFALLA